MKPCEAIGVPQNCTGVLCKKTRYGDIKGQKVFYYPRNMFWKGGCTGEYVTGTQNCTIEPTSSLAYKKTGYKAAGSWCMPKEYPNENRQGIQCNGFRELTLSDLYYNACARQGNFAGTFADFDRRENWCDTITDMFGNKRKPIACGGTDPDILNLSIEGAAIEMAAPRIKEVAENAEKVVNEIVLDKRKKAIGIVLVLLLIIVLVRLV